MNDKERCRFNGIDAEMRAARVCALAGKVHADPAVAAMCRTYAQPRWLTNDAELRPRSIRRAQCSDDTLCRGFLIRRENEPKYAVDALTSGFTKRCERTGCAALHVRCAASVHAVTLDAGAPRIFHAGGRDDVDVPREHEFGHARLAAAGSGEQHWVGRFREEDADVGLDAR